MPNKRESNQDRIARVESNLVAVHRNMTELRQMIELLLCSNETKKKDSDIDYEFIEGTKQKKSL